MLTKLSKKKLHAKMRYLALFQDTFADAGVCAHLVENDGLSTAVDILPGRRCACAPQQMQEPIVPILWPVLS
jgi:hypothetical protein